VTVKEPLPPPAVSAKAAVKVLLLSVAVPAKINEPPQPGVRKLKDKFKVIPDMVPEAEPVSESVPSNSHVFRFLH
jgi:hypothetical protein